MYRKAVIILILALAVAAGCTKSGRKASVTAAPDFTLKDLYGKQVSLSGFKGKVVLLEFWATWCPPCQASVPGIERLYKSYAGKGLVVLGVSLDEGGWDSVKGFAKESGITYPVLQGDEDVTGKYMIRSIPALFLVDKDGMIAKQYLGAGYEDVIEQDIRTLL
jgi:cytochrome c biogenesis protein CcmG/thiol:disulfide interchange protein DsbE